MLVHNATLAHVERSLWDARDSSAILNFNGGLKAKDVSSAELDKEKFVFTIKVLGEWSRNLLLHQERVSGG